RGDERLTRGRICTWTLSRRSGRRKREPSAERGAQVGGGALGGVGVDVHAGAELEAGADREAGEDVDVPAELLAAPRRGADPEVELRQLAEGALRGAQGRGQHGRAALSLGGEGRRRGARDDPKLEGD